MNKNISQGLIDILNYRIVQEEYSSRLYKAMAVWLEYTGFSGAAKLWNTYSEEELKHAGWAYEYLLDMDIKPNVPALEKPEGEYSDLINIIYKSYEHEQEVTRQCQELANKAFKEGDYMALELAQKYLKEQQEELAKTNYWINRLKIFGSGQDVLFLLDNEMGEQ